MTVKPAKIAEVVGTKLPDMMRESYDLGHCLSSSRIGLEVTRRLRVRATVVTTEVLCGNKAWFDCLKEYGWPDERSEFEERWIPRGAWSVGATPGVPVPGTDSVVGHTVLLMGDVMLDCALEQFRRPAKGVLPPKALSMSVPRAWAKGEEFECYEIGGGGIVCYRAHPHYKLWLRASGWTEPVIRDRPIIDALVKEVQNGNRH